MTLLGGRYELGEVIGCGGMAEVYLGRDQLLGRQVAIKVPHLSLVRDPTFRRRFAREAKLAARLNHPAIVRVYDTDEADLSAPTGGQVRVPFIVMERVVGHPLGDLSLDGLPVDRALGIVCDVLAALELAHEAGVVHRDIKPANVMIAASGAVKVMDFGIARSVTGTGTTTEGVIGTAAYLSPEQALGKRVDTRSDLYSAGCLLFELLTGRPPFVGDSPVEVVYAHVNDTPPRPSSLAPHLPPVLDEVVAKALAKDCDARYPSAATFRADLDTVRRDPTTRPPGLPKPPADPPTA
ncbi:MAG: protein kinase, partial [Cellulomonas sp.]|nr:protein kinase [Cellulomonas sp.]